MPDREEATKEEVVLSDDYDGGDEEEWETDTPWNNEGDDLEEDVADESNAYLEFLNEEV
jgi:hypothetical protein